MATLRDRPHTQFNFLVDLGDGNTEGPRAGFQEMSDIGTAVAVIEYRNGNSKENAPIKLNGLARASNVTLKHGVIGSLDLYQWLDQIRNRDQNALRTITIRPTHRPARVCPTRGSFSSAARTLFAVERAGREHRHRNAGARLRPHGNALTR